MLQLFVLLITTLYHFTNCHLSPEILKAIAEDKANEIDLSHFGFSLYGVPSNETGDKLAAGNWKNITNPEEVGNYLEGDILVPVRSHRARNGLINIFYRWPKGVIPYEIRGNFYGFQIDLIKKAFKIYKNLTCINFVQRKNRDRDYITIQNDRTGCWSSIGKLGGQQVVNFQTPDCMDIGTVIHELMHTVGFFHEQNREERDKYVLINEQNIQNGTELNFFKANSGLSGLGVSYDYDSIMHYSQYAFSKNGLPTITPKQNHFIGQRRGLSEKDIEKINRMYKCSNKSFYWNNNYNI